MVSPAHRFLHGVDLYASDLKQIWVMEGDRVTDAFFHDVYRGCVDLKTTLQLWAHESSGASTRVVTAVLTRDARLDFAANPDPEEAQRRFRGSSRRPPRYGSRPGVAIHPATEVHGEEVQETETAAEQVAGRVSGALGSGQGLQNLLLQARAAFQHGSFPMLLVVEDLYVLFRGMMARGESAAAHEIVVATRDVIDVVKAGRPGRVLVFLDPRSGLFQDDVLGFGEGIRRTTLPAPDALEINAALGRASRRSGFPFLQAAAVSSVLTSEGTLNAALAMAGRAQARTGAVDLASVLHLAEPNEAVVAEVLRELDALVGLDGPDGVKTRVRGLLKAARARRRDLVQQGVVPDSALHMVFEGNPGTGKTTVANIVGRLFHALGLLPRASVTEGKVSEIVVAEVGQTRQNMRELLTAAQGGVLFIDEAHQLAKDNGQEALEVLVPFAENHRADTVIILAGYEDGIRELFAVDPGLPSRFSNRFRFDDYGDGDLWQMMVSRLESRNWSLAPGVEPRLRRLVSSRKNRLGSENGRGVRNLQDELVQRHFDRGAEDRLIGLDDLPSVAQSHPKELAEAQAELDRLVGLDALRALLNRFRVNVEYALAHADPLPSMQGLRFVGPPGTGKTTVAQLLAKYLYGLGVIATPRTFPTTGAQLKGAYEGQTAPRVVDVFDRARGGLLFIDEAYGVARGGQPGSFSGEAIDTLVSELTRPQNSGTVVVIAGYEDLMDDFVSLNPGLTRRFPEVVRFASFTPAQLLEVAGSWAAAQGWRLSHDFGPLFAQLAARASTARDFGNAGWAENVTRWASDVMKERVMSGRGDDGVLTAADLTVAIGSQYPTLLPETQQPGFPSTSDPAAAPRPWNAANVLLAERPQMVVETDAQVADLVAGSTLPLTVVLDDGRQSMGTGFLISASGVIVTAAHVVMNARTVHTQPVGAVEPVVASVVATDEETDVAILQLSASDMLGMLPLALGRSVELARMQRLVVAGYNQTTAEEDCHTVSAAVMRNSPSQDPVHFEVDGAVEFGASGGPVFDAEQGAVVGIVHGGLGHTVKIMVRVEQILALLGRHGWDNRNPSSPSQPVPVAKDSTLEAARPW